MEFATMELNGNNNSYEDGKFIIRHHKTSKKTGEVIINVPKELQEVLDEWLDGRKTGLLLGGLTAPSITKHLNTIFKPKKIGVSALRHLYLQKYSSVKKEMMNDSRAMRHSVGTAIGTYVK
jgi:integrase